MPLPDPTPLLKKAPVIPVLTIERLADAVPLARALAAGGLPRDFVAGFVEAPVPSLPGCATVSEAMALAAYGFEVLKFFPAEASGGVAWLKSVAAPLPQIKFCPTGGIDLRNAGAYLGEPN